MNKLPYPYPRPGPSGMLRLEAMLGYARGALESITFNNRGKPVWTAQFMFETAQSALKRLDSWEQGGQVPFRWIWPGRRKASRWKRNRNL